ncbi:hypothetical protein G7K_6140-t1 [Saitoella complicata NRRL Y-17804]|uniref:Uncharacterized protein n=1 Tax=Saitoella complicata (strain BCRC 22490 / CBS 7301 / JCM 7358 / NBRC 10748 / NRRL Y-17804) TaxID=698492 RepID=A0A0E9NQI0_SAICN|nr:hypothetical protein G7K_6140-t1 [Saitoella complicata NRRL Y-17804]
MWGCRTFRGRSITDTTPGEIYGLYKGYECGWDYGHRGGIAQCQWVYFITFTIRPEEQSTFRGSQHAMNSHHVLSSLDNWPSTVVLSISLSVIIAKSRPPWYHSQTTLM